ncbi:MAG: glycerol-3-phosphate 1-O-acyltransferase PlsY [Opitutae bacterium]|nr:glycerol-3-phosphate 1-O-acyltransferase PlsY [Opitutae bacterium]
MNWHLVIAAVIGYLLGSLPFGWLVARAHGVDIFKVGSGNPGATNVKRTLGAKAGNTVFALDVLKGAAAAGWPLVAKHGHYLGLVMQEDGSWHGMETFDVAWPYCLTGLIGAVLGHSFSIFTKFRGGKGVATAAGGLIVLLPVSCAIAAAVWVATFLVTRYVSLGSILAAVAVSVAAWVRGNPLPLNIGVTVLALFVIVRHRDNIRRLLNGTESKFARKPSGQG